MRSRQVMCPSCGGLLDVPPGCANCNVRCGHCHHRFRLPHRIAVTDDAIASWLKEGRHADAQDELEVGQSLEHEAATPGTSGETMVLPAASAEIRLIKFGEGAIFEFPTSCLTQRAFRCSMPRKCLRCGARAHLLVHVVIFWPTLRDSFSLEDEHSAGELGLGEEQVHDLGPDELLDRLPLVPNVPPPGNLPMPYWVCDMCSGAGLISGQIEVNSQTGSGWCRLLIHPLRRALEFLQTAGGADAHGYQELHRHIESLKENPWENLPSVIQHRLEQWYRPLPGEQFVAYVPDRDHSRTEDGMNGLVVSNRRMVYHTGARHRELTADQPLKLHMAKSASKVILRISTPTWELRHFVLDPDGSNLLRRSLAKSDFRPVWQ